MRVNKHTIYEVEVTMVIKRTIDLDFDETNTTETVEEHAINDIKKYELKIFDKDIGEVRITNVFKK